MRELAIKEIGPISEVQFPLNRYNVFIGKQSSGKSTVAKIISHCLWLEKEVATHPYNSVAEYETTFGKNLEEFHNMKGYFRKESCVKYDSDIISIAFEGGECHIARKKNLYHRNKILYIPAERNIVVYSDSIGGANNLKSFSTDWQIARDIFDAKHKQGILNLGIHYYQEKENGKVVNRIVSSSRKNPYSLNLNQGSSGLQSVIPITVTIDFFTGTFYDPQVAEKLRKANENYDAKKLIDYVVTQRMKEVNARLDITIIQGVLDNLSELLSTRQTHFIIEEPEINIFPETQVELVNYLFGCSNRNKRKHCVTLTTHSPYTLSAINNLLLAGMLSGNKELTKSVNKITGGVSINPSELSVYAIQDGRNVSLQDQQTGLISQNYLDSVSDIIAGQFNELYKLYLAQIR